MIYKLAWVLFLSWSILRHMKLRLELIYRSLLVVRNIAVLEFFFCDRQPYIWLLRSFLIITKCLKCQRISFLFNLRSRMKWSSEFIKTLPHCFGRWGKWQRLLGNLTRLLDFFICLTFTLFGKFKLTYFDMRAYQVDWFNGSLIAFCFFCLDVPHVFFNIIKLLTFFSGFLWVYIPKILRSFWSINLF